MLITIAFEGESERDIVLRVEPDTTLQHVREELAAKAGMQPTERFRVGNANLDPSIEADTAVSELIGDDRVLKVKPSPPPKPVEKPDGNLEEKPGAEEPKKPSGPPAGEGSEGKPRTPPKDPPGDKPPAKPAAKPTADKPTRDKPPPKPTLPDVKPVEATWGLKNDADAADLLSQLQSKLGAFTVRDPDEFTRLPLDAVQALFTARRLNRGLRLGRDPDATDFGSRSPQAPVVYLHPDRPPHSGGVAFTARWTTSATASRVLHEMRSRSIHAASASGGLSGFGLSAHYRRDLETLQRSEVTTIHLLDEMIIPKVMLSFDPESDLSASPGLIDAVDRALSVSGGRRGQYEALHERVFHLFGYFFPCEALLGGTRMRTLDVQADDVQDQQQLLSGFGFGAAATDVPTSYGPASGEVGYANTNAEFSKNRHIRQLREQNVRAIGGNPALGLSDERAGEWVTSLDKVGQWEVIGNRSLVPILRFLPQEQRHRCVSVIEEFANSSATPRFTVLDMAAYVIPLNRDLLDQLM